MQELCLAACNIGFQIWFVNHNNKAGRVVYVREAVNLEPDRILVGRLGLPGAACLVNRLDFVSRERAAVY